VAGLRSRASPGGLLSVVRLGAPQPPGADEGPGPEAAQPPGNILTYLEHRLTNAVSEGLNGALSTLLRRAYGYRNLHNLTTVLYFYLGGLSMDPTLPAHANPG